MAGVVLTFFNALPLSDEVTLVMDEVNKNKAG